MNIEVVFAGVQDQLILQLQLPLGATVGEALELAKCDERFENIDASAVGVYGQLCEPGYVLQPGDRVEIYRELKMDAKTARRERALQQQSR